MGRVRRINAAFLLLCANQAALASLSPASTFAIGVLSPAIALSPEGFAVFVQGLISSPLSCCSSRAIMGCTSGLQTCRCIRQLRTYLLTASCPIATVSLVRQFCEHNGYFWWKNKLMDLNLFHQWWVFFAWIVFYSDAPRPIFHYCSYCSFRLWNTVFKQNPPAETN